MRKGDRVRLISTTDPYSNLKPGDEGRVMIIDAMGTIHVKWDSGSTLGLVPGQDRWQVIR